MIVECDKNRHEELRGMIMDSGMTTPVKNYDALVEKRKVIEHQDLIHFSKLDKILCAVLR